MGTDAQDWVLTGHTLVSQDITANWDVDWHPFSGAIAAAGTMQVMALSAQGLIVYGLHLVLDAGWAAGSADLTLELDGPAHVVDHFSTAYPFDDWIDYHGAQVQANRDILLRNNAAQAVTVRGVLYAHDRGLG